MIFGVIMTTVLEKKDDQITVKMGKNVWKQFLIWSEEEKIENEEIKKAVNTDEALRLRNALSQKL